MRRIESQMVDRIRQGLTVPMAKGKEWKQSNTRVSVYDDPKGEAGQMVSVDLHGNRIANITREFLILRIGDSRWFSRTTFSRFNSIINSFCDGYTQGVFTKKHVPYLSISKNKTIELETNKNYSLPITNLYGGYSWMR